MAPKLQIAARTALRAFAAAVLAAALTHCARDIPVSTIIHNPDSAPIPS